MRLSIEGRTKNQNRRKIHMSEDEYYEEEDYEDEEDEEDDDDEGEVDLLKKFTGWSLR